MDTATATLIAAVVASVAGVATAVAGGYFAYRQNEAVQQVRLLSEKVERLRARLAEERAEEQSQ